MEPRTRRLASLSSLVAVLPLLLLLVVVAPVAVAARSAPTLTLRPAALARGEGPAVPFVLGTTILDGDRTVVVHALEVQLLGTSGGDYLAVVYADGGDYAVERITPDGRRTKVVGRFRGEMTLSQDGTQLVETVVSNVRPRSVVRVLDPATGDLLQRRVFPGYARVLDADAGRLLIGSSRPARTTLWKPAPDHVRRVFSRQAYFADLRAGRVATYTRAAVDDGCSVLRMLSAPRTVLWRSCEDAVAAVSSDGRRMLTRSIVLDGPIGSYEVRDGTGRVLTTYRAPTGFGPAGFESRRRVLLTTFGAATQALVRCRVDACERASVLRPLPGGSG